MASKPRATGNHAKTPSSRAGKRTATTQSASQVIKAGNRRESLEALRNKLADALDVAEPNVIAQIAGRLQTVMAEIDALPVKKKVSKADELANRRAARRAAAKVPAPAVGEGGEQRT